MVQVFTTRWLEWWVTDGFFVKMFNNYRLFVYDSTASICFKANFLLRRRNEILTSFSWIIIKIDFKWILCEIGWKSSSPWSFFLCREKIVYIVANSQHSESLFLRYFQPSNPLLYRSFALLIVITSFRWLVARPQSLSPPLLYILQGLSISTANVVIQAGVLVAVFRWTPFNF